MPTVHLRINDSATGQPTPVRFRVSSSEGTNFAPLGRHFDFPTGRNEAVGGQVVIDGECWWYIDGSCEIALPSGTPLRVRVSKGPEYRPIDEMVTLGAGQIALRFSISRAFDWRKANYYSGDTRCHFLPPHVGLLEAMAEGLDVVSALARPIAMLAQDGNTYTTSPDLPAFTGQQAALSAPPNHTFVVNTFNSHPVLGKVGLLHSHRAVFPLTFGSPDDTDDWSICDWCDQCHRKGGLTVWVDPFEQASSLIGGEALVAAILGKIDAVEIAPGPRRVSLLPWLYRLWDAGFTLPLVGASGKDSNRITLGAMRTYSYLHGEFSLTSWVESIRSGCTFATSGPLVEFEANGYRSGEEFFYESSVKLSAKVESLEQVESLEFVANGQVIASTKGETNQPHTGSLTLQHTFTPAQPTWVAARCFGKDVFTHTSPIKIRANAQSHRYEDEAATSLVKLVEQTREWSEQNGYYTNPKRREQLLNRCDAAIAKLKMQT